MYRMNGPETKYIYMQTLTANNGPRPTIHVTTSKAPPFCLKIWRKKIQRMPKMFILIMNRRRFVTKSNMWRLSSTANSLWKSEQHLHIFNGNEITYKKNERDMRKSCITWLGVRKRRLHFFIFSYQPNRSEILNQERIRNLGNKREPDIFRTQWEESERRHVKERKREGKRRRMVTSERK